MLLPLLLSSATLTSALTLSRIPPSTPAHAQDLPKDLIGISIESAVFDEWAGKAQNSPNKFVQQTLGNLAGLTGTAVPIRIGGTPQDYTFLNTKMDGYINATFPPATEANYYPAASHVEISPKAAELCGNFPRGTPITWGLNFRSLNRTEIIAQAQAAYNAFQSRQVRPKGITLERFELGNEPDFYGVGFITGLPVPPELEGWNMMQNSKAWKEFTTGIVEAVGKKASFMFGSFAQFGSQWQWNIPQSLASSDLWQSDLTQQISAYSQHLYFGAFTGFASSPGPGYLLKRDYIRGNVSAMAAGVPLMKQYGIKVILGETNSAARHGIPSVSDTAEAAIWLVDYVLQLANQGISRVHLHNGVGYHYSLLQPVAIASGPKAADRPKVQAPYYGAYIASELIGSKPNTKIIELTSTASTKNTAGYAVYENGKAVRALWINYDTYFEGGSAQRSSETIQLEGLDWQGVSVKRFSTPYTGSLEGFTWGGLSLEAPSGAVTGKPVSEQLSGASFTISASEIVMLTLK